jgi:predicted homoserine dehydrogenase-like protein
MILVDKALERREAEGNPIRVAMVGAGFMGKAIAYQLCNYVPGMKLIAISNRNIEKARKAYSGAGVKEVEEVTSIDQLEANIRNNIVSITNDASLVCKARGIDAVIEVTGAVEFGAGIAMTAIENKKHIILVNADVDGTVGPILKVYADRNGVVYSSDDGDQPGVLMNLYRFVKSLGVKPVLCGNIKGLHDPYRNPTTQEGFATKWGQSPILVTSAADGSKISFEQAIVANGTGMRVAKRGMYGPTVPAGSTIKEVLNLFPVDELTSGPGLVDYVVGIAEPAPGVFILGTHDDPFQQHYLNLYKLGEGPLYLFYTPYHLCHFEVKNTVARAVLFHDATSAPIGGPVVEVITAAKTDLKAGQTLDGIGRYTVYGLCENADTTKSERLLPIGVAEGCILKRDVAKDEALTYDDVILPTGRIIDRLRKEQAEYFQAD